MVKALKFGALCLLLLAPSLFAADVHQYYFRFEIQDRKELSTLTRLVSLDECSPMNGNVVYAYANDRQWANFQTLGYKYELLPNPGDVGYVAMTDNAKDAMVWDTYPSYTAYVQMMNDFVTNYPALCQLVTIGTTNQGRSILAVKISDNVATDESEPEVLYTSSMHGDETTGFVLMLRLIDSLLVGYTAGNTRIQTMVNNMEIYINPAANPDGTYHGGNASVSGAWRYNSLGVDINRNFPDYQDGPHPDGEVYQVETNAFIAFANSRNFIISANFHGGTEVFNYPWDTKAQLHPDDTWWQFVGHQYVDTVQTVAPSTYFNEFNDGITNGYAWYEVNGGRQDFMNYWHGCREVTIEISDTKLLPAAQLPAHWTYNRLSLLHYLEQVLYGIKGVVTDAQTSQPLGAIVSVVAHDQDSTEVRCDPVHGNYYRMIAAGNWSLRFTAPGYLPQTVSNIITSNGGAVTVDVQLQPVPQVPVLSYVDDTAPAAISAGDNVAMKIILKNDGGGDAFNTQGVLSTTDAYVTITQNTSSYPMIPELGGTAQSNANYTFTVSNSCPQLHVINFKVNITADGGYSDSAVFALTVGQSVEDFETGNFLEYNWTMGGNAPWTIVSTGQYEGAYAAASGSIGNSQSSTLSVSQQVGAAGNISFYYKVSSEASWDWLRFYIDGVEKGAWSGSAGWAQASYPVTTGTHTFLWKYEKDGSQIGGSDKAWVDFIVFPPQSVSLVITTSSLPNGLVGAAYSQQLASEGGSGSKTWIDLGDNLSGTGLSLSSAGLLSGTPTAAGDIAFTARVTDQTPQNVDKPFSIHVIQCGDADGNLIVTISDAVFLINYIFSGGPAPETMQHGDADCNGIITISDAVALINYIFSGGPAPCSACK